MVLPVFRTQYKIMVLPVLRTQCKIMVLPVFRRQWINYGTAGV